MLKALGRALQPLLLVAACAAQDTCRNYHEVIFRVISPDLTCGVVLAEVFPGVNCETLGQLCPLNCGLCDALNYTAPTCDAAEVFAQKTAAVDVLRVWGVCGDCEAPEVWTPHSFVLIPPSAQYGFVAGSYASSTPGDPCSVSGVACNRCGEVVAIACGYPLGWPSASHVPLSLFRLHRLEGMIIERVGPNLPSLVNTPYVPADSWRSMKELALILLYDAVTGDLFNASELPSLHTLIISGNALYGSGDNLFGGPNQLGMYVDLGVPLEAGPLSDSICNSPEISIIISTNLNLVGNIPSCLSLPELEVLDLKGCSLTGPIAQVLNSTMLRFVVLSHNHFTGALPQSLSASSRLEHLAFEGNKITGTLPDLRNHTGLSFLNAANNRLTSAKAVGGSLFNLDLSDNLLEEFPESFFSMPSVGRLDLRRNKIREWPAAGVYPRGYFAGGVPAHCGFSPEVSAFDWPDMVAVFLSGNDLQGQDIRDILASLAYMPRLHVVEAEDCNLTMDLPMEGVDKMLSYFDAESCNLDVSDGFIGLSSLRLAGNRITGLAGAPWRSLEILDLASNDLTYVHPSWFGDDNHLVSLNILENARLRLPITKPSEDVGCQGATLLTVNPSTFLTPSPDAGHECASLCSNTGHITLVDDVANISALCRCRPGWYGIGMSCSPCPEGFFCPGGAELLRCAGNSSTRGVQSARETDCECNPGFYRIYDPPEPLRCETCPKNTYRSTPNARSEEECFPCAVDTTSEAGAGTPDLCLPCPRGTQPVGAGQGCRICTVGTYADNHTKTCQPCTFGQFQPHEGAVECIPCSGMANTTWRYIPAEDRYERSIGSSSGTSCACEIGHRPKGASCMPCGVGENKGLKCKGGPSTDGVVVLPGYYAAEGSEISVYRCWGEKQRCEGGLPGRTCRGKRKGLTCTECEKGYVAASDGGCHKCDGTSAIRLLAGFLLVIVAAVSLYYVIDGHARALQTRTEVILSSLLSIGVTAMQQLGLLSQMSIEWKEPLSSFLSAFLVLNFDIEFFHVGCVSSTAATTRFSIRVMMIFAFCALMVLIHIAFVMLRHSGRFQDRRASLVCSLGAVATFFYIPVVVTISGPLQCQEHPNGKWTSSAYPSVICWESSKHTGMVIASIAALLMPIGYLAHAAYTVFCYPSRVSADDSAFLKSHEFYFVRFKVECYWFILVQIIRNLVLALSVIIPSSAVAVFTAGLVQLFCGFITDIAWPWRSRLVNLADMVLISCIVVMFSGAFKFIPETDSNSDGILSWMCLVVVLIGLGSLLVICIKVVARRCTMTKKPFAFFISHHQAGAGAFARLLKTCLVKWTAQAHASDVYVRADNLNSLDELFSHVRSDTETVIVLWSREYLLRPWAVGELTIACLNRVRTWALIMPDNVPVTQEFRKNYQNKVDLETIFAYGITLDMVLESFSWLEGRPKVKMAAIPCRKAMDELVPLLRSKSIEQQGPSKKQLQLEYSAGHVQENGLCLLADVASPEAVAGGMVLERYVVQSTALFEMFVLPIGAALPTSSKAVLFLCTGGCMESTPYRGALAEAASHKLVGVPVVAEESFQFPGTEQVARMALPESNQSITLDDYHGYILQLFKEIAVAFHAQHDSEQVLRLAATTISGRLVGAIASRPSRELMRAHTSSTVTSSSAPSDDVSVGESNRLGTSSPIRRSTDTEMSGSGSHRSLDRSVPSERRRSNISAEPRWMSPMPVLPGLTWLDV